AFVGAVRAFRPCAGIGVVVEHARHALLRDHAQVFDGGDGGKVLAHRCSRHCSSFKGRREGKIPAQSIEEPRLRGPSRKESSCKTRTSNPCSSPSMARCRAWAIATPPCAAPTCWALP